MSTLKDKIPRLTQKRYERWIEALESGKFAQGAGELFNIVEHEFDDYIEEIDKPSGTKEYCCLGVLGRVVGLNEVEMKGQSMLTDFYGERYPEDEAEEAVELGVSVPTCTFFENHPWQEELAEMNDSGKTFKYIAARLKTKKWKKRLGVE